MDRNQAKSSQKPPKERGLYTPESVRERVVQRHVKGESKRKIAREERIDRETVDRILSQKEVAKMMAQYYSRLVEMVPKAARVFEKGLDSDDERVALGTAAKLMEFMRLHKGDIEQTIEAARPETPEERVDHIRQLGEIAESMWDDWNRGRDPKDLMGGFEWMMKLTEVEVTKPPGMAVP